MPVELILAPPSAPLSVYNFALLGAADDRAAVGRPGASSRCGRRASTCTEIGARHGASSPPATPTALRRRAIATAEQWVRDRQEADGSWGGIQPPWVWSILMLAALGRGLRRPVPPPRRRGLERLPRRGRRPAAPGGLPVARLGHGPRGSRAPRVRRARRRPAARQGGRMAARRGGHGRRATGPCGARRSRPGGWAFEFENDLYPDVDDAAVVCLALRELGARRGRRAARPRVDRRHAVRERRLGRVRRGHDEHVALQAPLLRLRRRHRPAVRGRERARARGARRRSGVRERRAARPPLPARQPAARRLLVGALGRQPPLRHRGGAACARGVRPAAPAIRRSSARPRGSTPSSSRTAASARTSARTTTPRGAGAAWRRLHKPRGR